MRTPSLIVAVILLLSTNFTSSAGQPSQRSRSRVTGFYSQISEDVGNHYGHSILIYRGVDYWAVYQMISEQELPPLSAHATVVGNSVEFTVEIEPGQPSIFRGSVKNGYLVGQFSTSSEIIKLKRVPL